MWQEIALMFIPPLLGGVVYAFKKMHHHDNDISILKTEMSSLKATAAERHTETLGLMKETRDDVREVRSSVATLVSELRRERAG